MKVKDEHVINTDKIDKAVESRVVSYHNWMYSFLPASGRLGEYVEQNLYVVAFCKNCNRGVTVKLEVSDLTGVAIITQTDIPKEGCRLP